MLRFSRHCFFFCFFFFNDTATTEIYTLSLHDALPICLPASGASAATLGGRSSSRTSRSTPSSRNLASRSEEHTSELQSHSDLVCRLLLEKKKAGDRQSAVEQKQTTSAAS